MLLIDLIDLEFIDRILRLIVADVRAEFGMQIITSLYRMDDDGVHGTLPLRGIDLRCKNHDMGKIIEKWTNERWEYDPTRPKMKVCLFHDVGRGLHLHFQSHPNTGKREYYAD